MSKNDIENRFVRDMDAFIDGKYEPESTTESQEYIKLLELGKILSDRDFSGESNKKMVKYMTINSIDDNKVIW